MAISPKLRSYMDRCGTRFDELMHEPAAEMARVAQAAHIPGRQVAKAVLVQAGDQYMLAVLPSSKHVSFNFLQQWLARDVSLAEEHTTAALFPDCELGAIPPVGAAYGLKTIIDDDMLSDDDVWFEGGDHNTLIHMNAANWRRLQKGAGHFAFAI
ncbi:aminoacyl-tRNA deacylase [Sphingobium estronivorans]|uniref:aminoacyl-tRNA deacylase n=1 Tax=Sphingobium estronivorans TaxID=1577690 RepID=UPI00123ACEA6|nr:YbaK/EbsC family protein [Sphingobium estronivorans]